MRMPKVSLVKVMEGVVVTVHYKHRTEAQVRLWLALRLMKLGCWIGRFGYRTEREDD